MGKSQPQCLEPQYGALLPGHPFDILYHFGLRRIFGGEPLPPYPLPRRFACLLATFFLTVSVGSFLAGLPVAGYVFGFSLTVAAAVNVATGFCIPSFLYALLFGRPGYDGK